MIQPAPHLKRQTRLLSTSELVELATRRVREGLPPPPEIYRVQHRNAVDWGQFPAWARPSDPELFGCHEG